MQHERTVAFIDLDILKNNYNILTESFKGKEILCSVKSEAYGHGSVEVSETFLRAGARWFELLVLLKRRCLEKLLLNLIWIEKILESY